MSDRWQLLLQALHRRGVDPQPEQALQMKLVLARFAEDLDAPGGDDAQGAGAPPQLLAHLLIPLLASDRAQARQIELAIHDAARTATARLPLPPPPPPASRPPRTIAAGFAAISVLAALLVLSWWSREPAPAPAEPAPTEATSPAPPPATPPATPPAATPEPPALEATKDVQTPRLAAQWRPPRSRLDLWTLAAALTAALVLASRRMGSLPLDPPPPPEPPAGSGARPPAPVLLRPVLLSVADRAALVAGVGRFIDPEPTRALDPRRTAEATARAGGRPELRFQPTRRDQRVLIWRDRRARDPSLRRIQAELAATLTGAGLPATCCTWDPLTDRLHDADGRRLPWSDLTDARAELRIAALTDGRCLLDGSRSAHQATVSLGLRRLAKLGGVIVAEADATLEDLLRSFSLRRVPREAAAEAIADPSREGRLQRTAAPDHSRLWAALCALSPLPIPEALAWNLTDGLGCSAGDLGRVRLALGARGQGDAAPIGGDPARRAHALHWLELATSYTSHGALPPAAQSARDKLRTWAGMSDAPEVAVWRALLRLWDDPHALTELHALWRTQALREAVHRGVEHLTPADAQRTATSLRLAWPTARLSAEDRWMAGQIGLGEAAGLRWDERRIPPDRREAGRFLLAGAVAAALLAALPGRSHLQLTPDGFAMGAPGPLVIAVTPGDDLTGLRAVHPYALPDALQLAGGLIFTPEVRAIWSSTSVPCTEVWAPGVELRRCAADLLTPPLHEGRHLLASAWLIGPATPDQAAAWSQLLLGTGSVDHVYVVPDPALAALPGELPERCGARCYPLGDPAPATTSLEASVVLTFGDPDLAAIPAGLGAVLRGDAGPPDVNGLTRPEALATLMGASAVRRPGPELLVVPRQEPTTPPDDPNEPPPADSSELGRAVRAAAIRPDGWEDPAVWATVPTGTWEVGTSNHGDEKPAWKVSLPEYKVLRVEVTNAWYRAAMNQPDFQGDEPASWPATDLTWNEAEALCAAIDATLPTEAEWEVAARAGTRGDYSFDGGQAALGDHAWFNGNSGTKPSVNERTHPVALKRPNPGGLYDMHGNTWEWTASCHTFGGYNPQADAAGVSKDVTANPVTLPWNKNNCFHSVRGGSAWSGPWLLRSGHRLVTWPTDRSGGRGFRCVRVPAREQPG